MKALVKSKSSFNIHTNHSLEEAWLVFISDPQSRSIEWVFPNGKLYRISKNSGTHKHLSMVCVNDLTAQLEKGYAG